MLLRAAVIGLALALSGGASASAAQRPEGIKPQHVTYQVASRTGGVIEIAALKWVPRGAKTVLLAVHGSGGVKENNWAPLSVIGYSFAIERYREGRATVAIDLPGYGGSGGGVPASLRGNYDGVTVTRTGSGGVEDYAFVVDQVARTLRQEFPKVVGVGHSIGALVVDVAQGMFRTFDAIIPASWSHGGYSAVDMANTCNPTPCANVRDILFYRRNADRRVVEDFVRQLERYGVPDALNFGVWGGYYWRPPPNPAPDDVTMTIDVPVLIIMGKKDWIFDDTELLGEYKHFPMSPDVTQLNLANTGHCVFHHRNYGFVERYVGNWLRARGL